MTRHRALRLGLVATSLALCSAVPLTTRNSTGDLAGYTDHLRHAALTRLALVHGAEVYRQTYGALLAQTPLPYAPREWLEMGDIYPPGARVLFLPPAMLAWAGLSEATYARWVLFYVLLLAHLAVFAVWETLAGAQVPLRIAGGIVAWVLLVHCGLCGQYDPVWVGCGALAIGAVSREGYRQALFWVVLAPLGALALWRLTRRDDAPGWKPLSAWPWATLSPSLVFGMFAAACAAYSMRWAGATRTGAPLFENLTQPLAVATITVTVLGVALCGWQRSPLVAFSVAIVGAVARIDSLHWWHAAIALPPLLAAYVSRAPRALLFRSGMIVWALVLARVFGEKPLDLFKMVGRFLTQNS